MEREGGGKQAQRVFGRMMRLNFSEEEKKMHGRMDELRVGKNIVKKGRMKIFKAENKRINI